MNKFLGIIAVSLLAISVAACTHDTKRKSVPMQVDVVRSVDGDTFVIETRSAGGMFAQLPNMSVRVRGIDTAEHGHLAKCQEEADLADRQAAVSSNMLKDSHWKVTLSNIKWDKYGGRIDAKVTLANGQDLSAIMIRDAGAKPYDGGRKSSWCDHK